MSMPLNFGTWMCFASAPRNVPLSSTTPVGIQMTFLDAQHPSILVLDEELARRPVRVRRVGVRLVVVGDRRLSPAEPVRPQISLDHDRFDGDHRPVTVVRDASSFVDHAHAGARPRPRVEHGDVDDGGDGAVERLVERAGVAVGFFVSPHVEVPVVDAQSPRTAPRELRPHVPRPDVAVLDLEEMDVGERHSFSVSRLLAAASSSASCTARFTWTCPLMARIMSAIGSVEGKPALFSYVGHSIHMAW